MQTRDEPEFIDEVYAAAEDPARWPGAIELFADLVGGSSVFLSKLDICDGSGDFISARLDPEGPRRYAAYYGGINPLHKVADPSAYMADWRPLILSDDEWMPRADLVASEYFNDFMRPLDVESVLMVRLALAGTQLSVLNINRPAAGGGFDRQARDVAERLHPHLIRAFGFSERIAAAIGARDGLVGAFDDVGRAAFLVDGDGRIRHASLAGERLLADGVGLTSHHGRLGASLVEMAARLERAIGHAVTPGTHARVTTLRITRGEGRPGLIATIGPVAGARGRAFYEAAALILVEDPEDAVRQTEDRLRNLYGVTRAEAKMALALLDGATPQAAAARLGISPHTARHHLHAVYAKTGTRRQADLVILLMRAARNA